MRVMVIVKATPRSEAGEMPTEELMVAMGKFNEELVQAGVLEAGDGLHPSAKGRRVVFVGDERQVQEGPFPATEELIAGFWVWKVSSMDEAIAWAKRCPPPMPGERSVLELRPIVSDEDFGEAFTPELRAQEDRIREQLAKQS